MQLRVPSFINRRWVLLSVAGIVLAFEAVAFIWVARYAVAVHGLKRGVGDTTFYDARGRAWFRMDEQRRDVPLRDISPFLQHAVIAVEDRRFYRHGSVDPLGILRAVYENLRSREVVQGASTITQQLARTLFLSNERTWGRKLKEAVIASLIELQLGKDRILELYLNRIYLSGGVYGVENASRKLFGKPARDLTLPEAALIAGLIRAPSALSPWSNEEGALARSHVVLAQMREQKFITVDAERAADAVRSRVRPYTPGVEARAGYAKDYLRHQFRDRFGGEHPPDWQVRTTFIPELQDMAEHAVARGLGHFRNPALQAALVAIDPQTGDVLALVGGRDFSLSQFNRAVRSERQPGSAFKPFVFAAALQRGFSPVSVLSNLNAVVAGGPEEWSPRNAHGELTDELTLRQALLESNNRAAVALEQRISAGPVLKVAAQVGLHGLPNVPSLALGTGEVTPFELTLAYAAFANGGWAVRPRSILSVLDAQGSPALENKVERERVLPEPVAFQMVSMLEDVINRGTGSPARALGVSFDAAGKTGTTDQFKDAWFVGFSTALVAGVWVGLDQPAPIGANAYGARVALPIWADFMRQAARLLPPGRFRPPAGMRVQELCKVSYLMPMQECPVYTEYFKEGDSIPSRLCPIHGGPFKQRAERVVENIFGAIGRKLKGIFGK